MMGAVMKVEPGIMSHFDLETMSLDELKALQKQVAKAIEGYKDRERLKALAELEAKAQEMGFSLSDLLGTKKTRKGAGIPKYRHPDDAAVTWTGKGRRPAWVNEALAAGKTMEDLAI
jgi:DNA-binding protein H-NS